ncbi:MAG: hypothetical protein FJX48_14885 [Alphaproteobacteria bacterium]|nr:hypothetical protein [Alphaproteobacteria bacterium]
MTTSRTIAALLEPTLLATAAMVFVNLDSMPTLIEELSKNPMLVVLAGYAAFLPGLAIVYFHNRWTSGWPVLITIVGWFSLIVGLLRMVFPLQIAAIAAKIGSAATMVLPVIATIFLLIGGALCYKGYGRI